MKKKNIFLAVATLFFLLMFAGFSGWGLFVRINVANADDDPWSYMPDEPTGGGGGGVPPSQQYGEDPFAGMSQQEINNLSNNNNSGDIGGGGYNGGDTGTGVNIDENQQVKLSDGSYGFMGDDGNYYKVQNGEWVQASDSQVPGGSSASNPNVAFDGTQLPSGTERANYQLTDSQGREVVYQGTTAGYVDSSGQFKAYDNFNKEVFTNANGETKFLERAADGGTTSVAVQKDAQGQWYSESEDGRNKYYQNPTTGNWETTNSKGEKIVDQDGTFYKVDAAGNKTAVTEQQAFGTAGGASGMPMGTKTGSVGMFGGGGMMAGGGMGGGGMMMGGQRGGLFGGLMNTLFGGPSMGYMAGGGGMGGYGMTGGMYGSPSVGGILGGMLGSALGLGGGGMGGYGMGGGMGGYGMTGGVGGYGMTGGMGGYGLGGGGYGLGGGGMGGYGMGGGMGGGGMGMAGLPSGTITGVVATFLQWLLGIFGLLALISFLISGIMYFSAVGNKEDAEKAKKNMEWSIIGVIVGLAGLIIVNGITTWLSGSSFF